jgi:hypothetical protein
MKDIFFHHHGKSQDVPIASPSFELDIIIAFVTKILPEQSLAAASQVYSSIHFNS